LPLLWNANCEAWFTIGLRPRCVDLDTILRGRQRPGTGPRPNVRGLVGSFRSWPICGSRFSGF